MAPTVAQTTDIPQDLDALCDQFASRPDLNATLEYLLSLHLSPVPQAAPS